MTIKHRVFYSFYYDDDVRRVQLIRNIGAFDDNVPVSANAWETIKRGGDTAVYNWIDENMKNKSCVIVLIGERTYTRKYVQYEIKKAWNSDKALLGIHIHNLKDPKTGICKKGINPFELFYLNNGKIISDFIHINCIDPLANDTYNDIRNHLSEWVDTAVLLKHLYGGNLPKLQ
jgi:hypothetical protein